MRNKPSPTQQQLQSMVNVALGKEKADLAILGGNVVNVYTGEILDGWSIATKGEWIAYVGDDAAHTIGNGTEVVDASGKTVIPGLIDGHAHLLHTHATIDQFLKYVLNSGTTTIISETLDFAFTLGYQGVIDFLESVRDQPIKVLATAPSTLSVGQQDYRNVISPEEFIRLFELEGIMGLGESNWVPVIRGDERLMSVFADALARGGRLEGHSAGARGNKLVAFAASGNSSDHESITAREALDRLRLGMHVMVREGDVRHDLEAIAGIKDEEIDFRRLAVTTDGIGAKHLIEHGYMDSLVQKAVDLGFDPVTAVQMGTLNVAEHFAIDDFVGGIAPSKYADIVIIPAPNTIRPEIVISGGRIVARDGETIVRPRKHVYPNFTRNTVLLPRDMEAADFAIKVTGKAGQVTARIIDLGSDIANKEKLLEVSVSDGELKQDIDRDILKVAAIDRINNTGKVFTGLIRGFGLKTGALAATAAWDVANIVAVGADDGDMAVAVNRIREMQGGAVFCAGGEVKAELPMPVAGQISELPLEQITQRLEQIQKTVAQAGCQLEYAHLMLNTLTTTLVPTLRISVSGLLNIKEGKPVDLMVK
ncbi:MAG: adenine deaminase C-terminal domain-containing protein [Dehalococcoidia bacterium]